MKELFEVVAQADALLEQGRSGALATVVRVEGSSYRRPGARMLVGEQGVVAGCVSGGCLEADVVEWARRVMESGTSRLLTYDTLTDEDGVFGLGTGCAGIVEVLVEPLHRCMPFLHALCDVLARERSVVLATVFRADDSGGIGQRCLVSEGGVVGSSALEDAARAAFHAGVSECVSIWDRGVRMDVFCELVEPAPSLLIFGAGPDAVPLSHMGCEMGWRTMVADHRPALLSALRFPGAVRLMESRSALEKVDARTAVALMTHNYELDAALLLQLAPTDAFYVGVLGSHQRIQRLWSDSGAAAALHLLGSRLHAPVGLDIGAATPETIALAIAAEIQAALAHRPGGSLCMRPPFEVVPALTSRPSRCPISA